MNGIDLALAKLDSALGNSGTSFDVPLWEAPTGSQVSPDVRKAARAASREGDKLGAVRLLVVAAVQARAAVSPTVLDDVEARVAETDGDQADRDIIAEAIAALRAPAPRRGLFGRRR